MYLFVQTKRRNRILQYQNYTAEIYWVLGSTQYISAELQVEIYADSYNLLVIIKFESNLETFREIKGFPWYLTSN